VTRAIAAVVLAAGASRRMGARNKLLLPVGGGDDARPMIATVVATVLEAAVDRVIVVVGHDAERVRAALDAHVGADPRLHVVQNADHDEGIASSIRAGVAALDGGDRGEIGTTPLAGIVIALGDMPWVRADDIARLVDALGRDDGPGICVPVARGADRQRGNPVLFARRYFAALCSLRGDRGARALVARHPDDVCFVDVAHDGILRDVDTASDIEQRED
jgi:molybdenum cofactor cytidylyltransferase